MDLPSRDHHNPFGSYFTIPEEKLTRKNESKIVAHPLLWLVYYFRSIIFEYKNDPSLRHFLLFLCQRGEEPGLRSRPGPEVDGLEYNAKTNAKSVKDSPHFDCAAS